MVRFDTILYPKNVRKRASFPITRFLATRGPALGSGEIVIKSQVNFIKFTMSVTARIAGPLVKSGGLFTLAIIPLD